MIPVSFFFSFICFIRSTFIIEKRTIQPALPQIITLIIFCSQFLLFFSVFLFHCSLPWPFSFLSRNPPSFFFSSASALAFFFFSSASFFCVSFFFVCASFLKALAHSRFIAAINSSCYFRHDFCPNCFFSGIVVYNLPSPSI